MTAVRRTDGPWGNLETGGCRIQFDQGADARRMRETCTALHSVEPLAVGMPRSVRALARPAKLEPYPGNRV